MPLTPGPLIDYEKLLEARRAGEPLKALDVAKAVAWFAIDPTGIYRAAGNSVLQYLDKSKLTDDDSMNVREILEAGRSAGCEVLEIEIEKDRFMGLRGDLVEPDSGIKVDIQVGAGGKAKYKIRAKYK